ncbi:hypothetical protein [Clostridium novyi]|uniref:Class I SAM-dependent methyltransferase n=1 Tax=Clostridium novyi (strain NT) TaxID=386415 RepID=A0Q0D0_CLONN|nr:hypothetical protein [Clostridium novyi]ABK61877.1 hypothetical protein NT01CX_2009 [Clostridium novyi NT]KEH85952.1 hypothetical protein Z966_05030 [Clostridium novyi A str. NCTC 538]KEH93376.1 hypothetical protein Z964_03270 [Clostridium novyi A str. GD211209]
MSEHSVEDSLKAWEFNAEFWDNCIGDESNQFHREVVRPRVSELMDISDISILFQCVNCLLKEDGIFVFATQHPCFVTLTEKYLSASSYNGEAISGQPMLQCYYHRSLQEIFNLCFQSGFVIDGFYEESFGVKEKPDVIIVRARKCNI